MGIVNTSNRYTPRHLRQDTAMFPFIAKNNKQITALSLNAQYFIPVKFQQPHTAQNSIQAACESHLLTCTERTSLCPCSMVVGHCNTINPIENLNFSFLILYSIFSSNATGFKDS